MRMHKYMLSLAMVFLTTTNAVAVDDTNQYQATYGQSNIVQSASVYPTFVQGGKLPAPENADDELSIVVASTKEVKLDAVTKFFSNNIYFKTRKMTIIGLQSVSGVAHQPIGLNNALLGARNRIKSAKSIYKDQNKANTLTYYVAIENFFSELTAGTNPTDHALVIIETPDGKQYNYLSEGVQVDAKVYGMVVNPKNRDKDGTGVNTSIGEYLAKTYKINSSEWFSFVTSKPYSREQQILTAFSFAN